MLHEFAAGFGLLGRGFGFWAKRPGVMALGLVPAAIVFTVLLGALVAFGIGLPALVEWATPFADGWQEFWRGVFRFAIGALTLAGAMLVAAVTFTALTLAVGDPFYERIWRAVEVELGGEPPNREPGFWRIVGDTLGMIGLGILSALAVWIVGLVPGVGTVAAAVLGVALAGRLLARELMQRAFAARGIEGPERAELVRRARWRVAGFGVATQLCFLVPLGAVATMPAAVAGATMLARGLLADPPTVEPGSSGAGIGG